MLISASTDRSVDLEYGIKKRPSGKVRTVTLRRNPAFIYRRLLPR